MWFLEPFALFSVIAARAAVSAWCSDHLSVVKHSLRPPHSPVHLPRASAPTILPHPTSPAPPPPAPEVRLSSLFYFKFLSHSLQFQMELRRETCRGFGLTRQKNAKRRSCPAPPGLPGLVGLAGADGFKLPQNRWREK